jgi:uncharacterized protein
MVNKIKQSFILLAATFVITISCTQFKKSSMSEKELVVNTINGMFMAADKRDWPACQNYFVEKPFIDYSSLSTIPGAFVPAVDLVNGWKKLFVQFKFTQHLITNFDVQVNGDEATALFYGHALHHLPHAKGGDMWEVYGTYDVSFLKTSGSWKISSFKFNLKYQKGNKNLPALAAASPLEQKVTFTSEGDSIIGKLILPSTYKDGQKLPVIMVFGAWTQVKEQSQYVYGRKLAEKGFAVLNFDFRFWGESAGKPRYFESTNEKVKDVLNAIAFLKTHPAVDASNISLIGICAGAGVTLRVSAVSKDIKRTATVAAWLQHPTTTPMFYRGEAGVQQRINLSEAAEKKFRDNGEVEYVDAYNPNNPTAAMFFPLDYYGNIERGRIPEWHNQFAVMGWKEWMIMNSIDGIAERIHCPLIMVHSDGSSLPDNVRTFYGAVPSPVKKLVWLQGEHTQFYDNDEQIDAAIGEIINFFESK